MPVGAAPEREVPPPELPADATVSELRSLYGRGLACIAPRPGPSAGRHDAARRRPRLEAAISLAVCAVLAITGLGTAAGQQQAGRIALTFDDLPVHGPLPSGVSRLQVARSILETLRRHGVPEAFGFINAKPLREAPEHAEVLRAWREAGYPLGNHAYSHMDLHTNTVEAFERDVLANEGTLRDAMGALDWRWFRFPYLREGETPEKYQQVRAMLARHGYRVAQVTVSFDDYAYNDPYVRCVAQGDRRGLEWLERSYLERAAESLARAKQASYRIFGRDIPHVMLLHVGAFQMVILPQLMDVLRDSGFAVVTLAEAQADAAYAEVPTRNGARAGTFLDQLLDERVAGSEAWQRAFGDLAALCRAPQ